MKLNKLLLILLLTLGCQKSESNSKRWKIDIYLSSGKLHHTVFVDTPSLVRTRDTWTGNIMVLDKHNQKELSVPMGGHILPNKFGSL